MTIGQSIKKARKDKGYTMKELAYKSGVTISTLNNWENGRVFPFLIPLIAVADVLGITLDELVGRTVKNETSCT